MKPWESLFRVVEVLTPMDRINWVVLKIGEDKPYYGKYRKYGYSRRRDAARAAAHHYKMIEKGMI